jgi:hypothetical protein
MGLAIILFYMQQTNNLSTKLQEIVEMTKWLREAIQIHHLVSISLVD